MAKIDSFDRITKEDFAPEDQELIGKLAYPLNRALESINRALVQSLTFEDNFKSIVKDVELSVAATGSPSIATSFQWNLGGSVRGLVCIRAENLTNAAGFPTTAPWVSFTQDSNQIIIQHVSGLVAGQKYKLRLIALS